MQNFQEFQSHSVDGGGGGGGVDLTHIWERTLNYNYSRNVDFDIHDMVAMNYALSLASGVVVR